MTGASGCPISTSPPRPFPPQPALWSRIEARSARSPAAADAPAAGWLAQFWNNLNAWRAIGLAAAATAMLLAVGLGFAVREAQRTPAMIAVLVDGNKAGAVVHVFNDGRAVLLPLTDIAVPADRELQVWTLPSRERGPVSVGLDAASAYIGIVAEGYSGAQSQPVVRNHAGAEEAARRPGGRPVRSCSRG